MKCVLDMVHTFDKGIQIESYVIVIDQMYR